MKTKNIIFGFITLGLLACNTSKLGKLTLIEENSKTYYSKFLLVEKSGIAIYECEDFVSNALNNYSISTLTKNHSYLKCSKKPIVNIHNSSIIDTIYTFSNSKNNIQIYRSKQKDLIFSFDVTNSDLSLTGNIHTGMAKDQFFQIFQITVPINNKVQITDSNGTIKFIFAFKNNRLNSIKSDLYID